MSHASTTRDYGDVTGVLLVGGASRRFGTAKALASFDNEVLAVRMWRLLGEAFGHRMAVGKRRDELDLPFPIDDDGVETRAPLAGLVAALRTAPTDVCVAVPVDVPLLTAKSLHALAAACRDAAVPSTGPLPGAYRRRALPILERRLRAGRLKLRDAVRELDAAAVEIDPGELANVNEPADLERLRAAS